MDQLVTIFGGGGFLGRYVAQALLRAGAQVRIAQRDPQGSWFVKPLGGLGQTQFVAADVTKPGSVLRATEGSDAVVNLVGILKGDFERVHIEGAANIAQGAASAGAAALVQVSALGADPQAPSAYARSKAGGEQAARAAFPQATILRPSILFGPEDRFVNRFAEMARMLPVLPIVRADTRFQPAYVNDVARAVATAALDPAAHGGRTYELGGPQIFTLRELIAWIAQTTGRDPAIVELPDPIARTMARFGGWMPGAPITWNQWLMLQADNVAAPDAPGFAAFGVDPAPLAAVAPAWLVRYRRNGRFARKHNAA